MNREELHAVHTALLKEILNLSELDTLYLLM